MARQQVTVSVRDFGSFQKLVAIVKEYARHGAECPLADDWREPRPECRCGLDEALDGLPGDEGHPYGLASVSLDTLEAHIEHITDTLTHVERFAAAFRANVFRGEPLEAVVKEAEGVAAMLRYVALSSRALVVEGGLFQPRAGD